MAGSGVQRTRAQVAAMLEKRTEGRWRTTGKNVFLLWDDRYYIPSAIEARNLAKYACTDLPPYSADDFDCDDFAFYARGRAGAYAARQHWSNAGVCVGLFDAHCDWVNGVRHMACWVLCRDDEGKYRFFLVDPQDYVDPEKAKTYPRHEVTEINRMASLIG